MKAVDEKWVVPFLALSILILVAWVQRPQALPWYHQSQDLEISPLAPERLASWIIEGRNDFVPLLLLNQGQAPEDHKIPGLVSIQLEQPLKAQLKSLPLYKTWVLISPDGQLSQEVGKALVSDTKRQVMQLDGGSLGWKGLILADQPDWSKLDRQKKEALTQVRPWFKPQASPGAEARRQIYLAPITSPPPALGPPKKKKAEEGC